MSPLFLGYRGRVPLFVLALTLAPVAAFTLARAGESVPATPTSSAPAKAGVEAYQPDLAHSNIGFNVRHLVSKVPGRFRAYTASIRWNPANLAATQVEAEIDASSIDTGNEKRDNHLRSPDFFEVEKFPKLTFKSTSVKAVDATHAQLSGDLTIKGITKPVTLDVEVLGVANGMRPGEKRAGFEAHGKINRKDFNILWNRSLDNGGFLLGDDVELVLQIEALKPSTETPPAAPPAAAATPKKG